MLGASASGCQKLQQETNLPSMGSRHIGILGIWLFAPVPSHLLRAPEDKLGRPILQRRAD